MELLGPAELSLPSRSFALSSRLLRRFFALLRVLLLLLFHLLDERLVGDLRLFLLRLQVIVDIGRSAQIRRIRDFLNCSGVVLVPLELRNGQRVLALRPGGLPGRLGLRYNAWTEKVEVFLVAE